jgi:glycosyltransferase involved in cell wall biosynthesis
MKLSVVICAKNDAQYMEKCLLALRKQLLRPEIVVVYGESKDDTVKVARQYADVVVRDNGKGLTAARNVGWKHSSGDIVAYCDADTLPNRDWTLRIANHFANPSLVALSGPLILSGKSKFKVRFGFRLWAELFPDAFALIGHHNMWGANMAFRRSILEKIPFKSEFLEDYEIGSRLRHTGFKRLMKFDYGLKMPTSDRRFLRSFHRLALKYYAINWLRIIFKKPAKGYY